MGKVVTAVTKTIVLVTKTIVLITKTQGLNSIAPPYYSAVYEGSEQLLRSLFLVVGFRQHPDFGSPLTRKIRHVKVHPCFRHIFLN